jgi:hypothetical protein
MGKQISLLTAIILSGFLGIALPGCSEDRNKSGDGSKSSGDARAPHPVQGAVLARAEQAAALAAQELVDQVEAVQGEAVHRLILPCRSHRCAQSSLANA